MADWKGFSLLFVCCFHGVLTQTFLTLNGDWIVTNSNNSIHVKGTVPGGIYTDLQHAGIIGDPYYRFNDIAYRWVAKDDWNYSRQFLLSSDITKYKDIKLVCKGLDTVSSIYINDNFVGKSFNMFVQYSFDIKPYIKVGENTVNVLFKSPVTYAEEQYEFHLQTKYLVPPICPPPVQNGECHANFIRKIQSEFSWDWGPAFPSVGIWKDIGIEANNDAQLQDVIVSTVKDDETWELHLRVFSTVTGSFATGKLVLLFNDVNLSTIPIKLMPNGHGISENNVTLKIPKDVDVKLWWPNGAGNQTLYNLTLILTTTEVSVKSINIGFRTIELIQEAIPNAAGASFYFKINGKAIFMKGSNWIPADSFPERITPQYTRRLLQSAKDAHMNVLRVWGGGMYETDIFYNIADDMGIMIWQDFMFACSMYPTTSEFLDNVKTEITQQVKRLHHHPSVLIWSGNNENEAALVQNWYLTNKNFELYKSDYLKLYADTVEPLVKSLDTDRPFILSSPSNGKDTEREGGVASNPQSNYFGDVHYYNYLSNSWNWTIYPTARFVSEYGFQSWASFETLSKVSVSEDWSRASDFFDKRQHHPLGNLEMSNSIAKHFGYIKFCRGNDSPCNKTLFKNYLYLTQITQAMGIKTESEHYLRCQSSVVNGQGLTMGALYWQLNDIWQCPSWASIEFGGKWKMLHYYARNFFGPLVASPYEDKGKLKVSVISDASVETLNLTLSIAVYQWKSFKPLYINDIAFTQKGSFASVVYEQDTENLLLKAKCPGRPYCFIYFTLKVRESEEIISSNFHFLTEFQTAIGLTEPKIKLTVENESCDEKLSECSFDVILISEGVAVFVWLEAEGISGSFSDNGFLIVNSSTRLKFHSWEKVSTSDLSSKLSVTSIKDIYMS